MNCKKCGNNIPDNALFCSNCGEKMSQSQDATNHSCPKCASQNLNIQAVPNKTKRRLIKTVILLIVFIIPLIWGAYINRDYSIPEGMLLGGLIAIPLTIICALVIRVIFKFIPEPYDTLFMCNNCGYNWRKH